jgi:integrase
MRALTNANIVFYVLLTAQVIDVPKAILTSSLVEQSRCPTGARRIDFFDADFPGFMLEVRCSGGKTFYQRYRDSRGRERQFKIGSARVLTIRQARRKARAVLADAILGNDPQRQREELRTIPTFAEFIRDSYLPFAKNVKRSWRTDETILRIHIIPRFGRLPLDQISNQGIADLLRHKQNTGYASGTTNRVLVLLRFVFNLAHKWGVPGSSKNPTVGLKTVPDVYRERFLTPDEARRLLAALDTDENRVAARAIKMLLMTGARRNEITQAKWEYVNWERRTLLVPCSKSGRSRSIHLNSAALDVLRSIPRTTEELFVFPSPTTGRPSSSLHFPWSRIRKRSGLLDVRLHDLRHSFASFLVNKGVSLYIVQSLLGHTQVRATQRYAHLADETLSDAAEVVQTVVLPTARVETATFDERTSSPASIESVAARSS